MCKLRDLMSPTLRIRVDEQLTILARCGPNPNPNPNPNPDPGPDPDPDPDPDPKP